MNQADFQKGIEKGLAWMLSMEERLVANFVGLQPLFDDGGSKVPANFRDALEIREANDIAALESVRIQEAAPIHERFVTRLEQVRKQFNAHEVSRHTAVLMKFAI